MRIVKLGTREFPKYSQIEDFFERELLHRDPAGKFRMPSPLIGKNGLAINEKLLFAYKGTIYYSGLAASQRMDNDDKYSEEYPFYFLINTKSLKRTMINLSEVQEIINQRNILENIINSRSWPIIKEKEAENLIWQLTTGRKQNLSQAAKRKYGSGGEGPDHKNLKLWITKNPSSIGLKNVRETKIEHSYLSGDTVDILFELKSKIDVVVEIETIDPLPGCFQAIKYRALRCAEKGLSLSSPGVHAVVVAWKIPSHAMQFCKKYNIKYYEIKI